MSSIPRGADGGLCAGGAACPAEQGLKEMGWPGDLPAEPFGGPFVRGTEARRGGEPHQGCCQEGTDAAQDVSMRLRSRARKTKRWS